MEILINRLRKQTIISDNDNDNNIDMKKLLMHKISYTELELVKQLIELRFVKCDHINFIHYILEGGRDDDDDDNLKLINDMEKKGVISENTINLSQYITNRSDRDIRMMEYLIEIKCDIDV